MRSEILGSAAAAAMNTGLLDNREMQAKVLLKLLSELADQIHKLEMTTDLSMSLQVVLAMALCWAGDEETIALAEKFNQEKNS